MTPRWRTQSFYSTLSSQSVTLRPHQKRPFYLYYILHKNIFNRCREFNFKFFFIIYILQFFELYFIFYYVQVFLELLLYTLPMWTLFFIYYYSSLKSLRRSRIFYYFSTTFQAHSYVRSSVIIITVKFTCYVLSILSSKQIVRSTGKSSVHVTSIGWSSLDSDLNFKTTQLDYMWLAISSIPTY